MRIFISSTCYDLIDLRAELESFFRDAGITPLLSDSLSSEFQTSPDRNSIETCLANVRNCDAVVVILSSRYGPSLRKAGYDDLSATHLEYREAVAAKIPVYMYVRDRLEADFAIWKENPEKRRLSLAWCRNFTDWKVFELLTEHRKLTEDKSKSNWFWIFKSSLDLKERLKVDFRTSLSRAQVDRLFENGRIPHFEIIASCKAVLRDQILIDLGITNLSNAVAVRPRLHIGQETHARKLKSIKGQDHFIEQIQWVYSRGTNLELALVLDFSILEGHRFREEGTLKVDVSQLRRATDDPNVSYEPTNRTYVEAETLMRPAV